MISPTISSPLRKIERCLGHNADDSRIPSLHSFERFDTIFQLSPSEILELQRDQFDYICGVTSAGRLCKNSLYCRVHLFEERMDIARSLPLPVLVSHEIHNKLWFRKKRRLVKLYHDCKAYWNGNCTISKTPETCSRSSCISSHKSASTKKGSETSEVFCLDAYKKKRFALLKQAFLKKILNPVESNKNERMSYLVYKLSLLEFQGMDLRTRELEVRFSNSE